MVSLCGQQGTVAMPPGGRCEQRPVGRPGYVAPKAPHRLAFGLAPDMRLAMYLAVLSSPHILLIAML